MTPKEQNHGVQVNIVGGKLCLHCRTRLTLLKIQSRQKFCSHKCYSENKIGKHHSWGWKIGKSLKGKPKSRSHIEHVRAALLGRKRPELTGEKHFAWKGDSIGYEGLHDWVSYHLGRPKECSMCGLSSKHRWYHWANISGRYKRDLSDWIRLCVPCHSKMDRSRETGLSDSNTQNST